MLVCMNAHRITPLVAAFTLAAVPVALGASPPKGSHGQETDRARVAQVRVQLCGSGATVLTSRSLRVVPKGSHGQETDQPSGTLFTLRQVCAVTPRKVAKATPPRGSHGQETDLPRAHS
jgi:hypothetical protein